MAPYTYTAFLVLCFGIGWAAPWLLSSIRHDRTVEFFCSQGVVKWRHKA